MTLHGLLRRMRLGIRPDRPKPDFLIIGAARCGTTSLFHYLAGHRQVAGPRKKELHFFDRQYDKGLSWYLDWFATTGGDTPPDGPPTVRGEATPYYIFHPHAIQRIRADLPNIRLIALVRNPVDRAYSHYWHMVRLGHERLSFEDAVACEPQRLDGELERSEADAWYHSDALVRHSYLCRGLYASQLVRVFRYFPRERVKILKSEDLYRNPQDTFDDVTHFLGIERRAISSPVNMTPVTERTEGWRPAPMQGELRRRLLEFFRPHNEQLYALLGRDFAWENEAGV